jgi:hypothetical protein
MASVDSRSTFFKKLLLTHLDVLVEDWEANHACCCALHLDYAAQGDTKTLNTIRTCMGLPGVSSTPLGSP